VRRSRSCLVLSAIAAIAACVPIAACSLVTDLDGLAGTADVSPLLDSSDGLDAAQAPEAPQDSAPVDAGSDSDASCRPGFTGPTCAPCPAKTSGPACDFKLVLGLSIPLTANWQTAADVPYSDNASATVTPFTRVAYRLVLDTNEVWVEVDAFTQDATRLGVPVDWTFDVPVSNAIVRSFASNQVDVLVPTAGNIEFWSNCYSEGDGGSYDHDDTISPEVDCYGSMQVHVNRQPVLSFNRWSQTSTLDVGIGRSPIEEPDWTFAQNASTFTTRRLEVYVR
jgi:hypothetical protein